MIKKFFYISLFLLILTLIILVAYNMVFKSNSNSPKASSSTDSSFANGEAPADTVNTTTPAAPSKIEDLLNEKVIGAVTGPGGALFYYSADDEAIKKATFEGKDKQVLLSNLPGVTERVVWSPKRDQALIALRQGGNLRWHTLAVATKTLTPLKPEVARATFNQRGDKIIYQYNGKDGTKTLDTANVDGGGFQTLTSLGKIDHFIEALPQSNRIIAWTRPNGLETTILRSFAETGQDAKTLLEGRYGADYLPSPNGKHILVSMLDARGTANISLAVMNENGGELRALGIPTMISKVAWSSDNKTLYYALPGNLPAESVLPNDYFQKPLFSEDTFWKIDTETGQKTRLIELDETNSALDSSNLFLSNKEDYLFFINRKDQKLYRLEL